MRWVPIFGEFNFSGNSVVFKGELIDIPDFHDNISEASGAEGRRTSSGPSLGLALTNRNITNGTLRATVRFAEISERTACELVVGYDVETKGFISAGITAFEGALYSIREWNPGGSGEAQQRQAQWVPYQVGGDRSLLEVGRDYSVQVSILGSRISLAIDDVRVAVATLRTPSNRARPVGLWCLSSSEVTVEAFQVEVERPRAFVVMQFSQPFDDIYSEVIRQTCDDFQLEPVRADEIYGPGLIINDIADQILRAQVVIAEVTPANANVYFEVGFAYAWGKSIILLARKGADLPFDVSGFRVLFYEDSIGGRTNPSSTVSPSSARKVAHKTRRLLEPDADFGANPGAK